MKIIEKILDLYFAKKLIQRIDLNLCIYDIDRKFTREKNIFSMYIKLPKYNERHYKLIYSVDIDYSLNYLLNFEEIIRQIGCAIEEYLHKEGGK